MTLRFQHKLSIPSAAFPLIKRPDLLERLEQAITSKQVAAVAALAGWGKTTALAQWALQTVLPVAWYTLDSTDRDPCQFLDYVLASAEPHVPGVAELLQRLAGTSPQALPELFRQAALLVAAAPQPFALVLDDFHVLEDENLPVLPGSELIFEFLAKIAEYATHCHLVLASRMLPNIQGLARLIAQRRAVFFDYAVLQWSAEDIQQLALKSTGVELTPSNAAQLALHMNGWVTGIILSLDQDVSTPQPVFDLAADASHVYAFFAEQIIAPLPPDLLRFLEDTSVLEDLSPQRCNALRHTHDAGAFLAEITRRGLFISQRGSWLTYHSLFRDFLRARLAHDPVRERVLLLRAAELYRGDDELDRALECYLAARADAAAITLLRDRIPSLRQRSRQNTLLACFERLATYLEQTGRERILPPDLLLAQVRVYGDLALWDRAEIALRLAETVGDEHIRLEAAILSAELLLLQGFSDEAQEVLNDISRVSLPPSLQLEYYLTLGRAQILSDRAALAIDALEAAYALAPQVMLAEELPLKLAIISDNLGWVYATRGERITALRHLKRADACWQASGNHGRRAVTLNNIGMLAVEERLNAEARAAFVTGLDVARQTARYREELYLQHSLAELEIIEGSAARALEIFQAAYELAVRVEVASGIATAVAGALWAAALIGRSGAARQWAAVFAPLSDRAAPTVRARVSLANSLLSSAPLTASALPSVLARADDCAEALSRPERAYLALLHAAAAFAHDGWQAAESHWTMFEQSADLPDLIVHRLVHGQQALLQAAANSSERARHLLATIDIPAQVRWNISTLGQFACLVDGAPVDLSPLHRALLVRLLDAGDAGLTVDRLWEEVWGDSDLRMSALHKALFRVREQTGLAMAAKAGHCAIQSPWSAIDYDTWLFERAIAQASSPAELEEALALYRGDFLPGAALSAALWIDRRRLLLQQQYLAGLERLAHLLEDSDPRQAIQIYQQILGIDGCREETAAQLMRVAARQRNMALVNATYEQLASALRTLGASPEPATLALLQATTRGTLPARQRATYEHPA